MAAKTTNVAKRMDKFFRAVVTIGGANNSRAVMKVVAEACGLENVTDDVAAVTRISLILAMKLRDCDAIRDKLLAREPDMGPHGLQDPMAKVRNALCAMIYNPFQKWHAIIDTVDDPTVRGILPAWGAAIGPDEPAFDGFALNEFRDTVRHAREVVLGDSSTDEALRSMLFELLALLDDIIVAYEVGGMDDVRRATRQFFVASYAVCVNTTPDQQKSSAFKAVESAIDTMRSAIDVAVKADGIYSLWEHGQQLLSWGFEHGVLMITHQPVGSILP